MSLSEHVDIQITQDTVGIAQAGFGEMMILSANAAFAERLRYYGSLSDVAVDFASTTSPEYLAAQAAFSQSPRPQRIAIGRAALKPTMKYELDVLAVTHLETYAINVIGDGVTETDVSITADSATTQAEIHSALVTALNAVANKNFTAAFAALVNPDDTFTAAASDVCTAVAHGLLTGDGPFQLTTSAADLPLNLLTATDYWIIRLDADTFKLATSLALALAGTAVDIADAGTGTHTIEDAAGTKRPDSPFTVTGDAAGEWFSLEVVNPELIKSTMTHANPGVATDLTAINKYQPDWYALVTLYNSEAYVDAVADWVEANLKIYIPDVSDSESITLAVTGGDNLDALHTQASSRTMGAYHPSPANMLAAAWFGAVLVHDPGAVTFKWKNLSGVTPVVLTATHKANLRAKKANTYETIAGRGITWEGYAADGGFLDVVRDLDWLQDDMQTSIYAKLAAATKVPFTDAGIALVQNEIIGSLRRAVSKGVLSDNPEPVCTVPLASDVSDADKATRTLPDMKFTGTLAGAIHKVEISGVVSL